jgi:hypothetical protein
MGIFLVRDANLSHWASFLLHWTISSGAALLNSIKNVQKKTKSFAWGVAPAMNLQCSTQKIIKK